jgi:hypothetical protein
VAEVDRVFLVARSRLRPDDDLLDGSGNGNGGGGASSMPTAPAEVAALLADKLERLLRHELRCFGRRDGDDEADTSFSQRFAEKVIDNLQVCVGRVHVRYEYAPDARALRVGTTPFAVGVIIHELSGACACVRPSEAMARSSGGARHFAAHLRRKSR